MRTFRVALSVSLSVFTFPTLAAGTFSDGWEWLKQDVSQTWKQPQYYDLFAWFRYGF